MEKKKRVSLTAFVGDYQIGIGNEYHSPLFCILIRKADCAKLIFYCPLPKMLVSSLLTFEYEINDGLIEVSHISTTDGKNGSKEVICRIPTSLIDDIATTFNGLLQEYAKGFDLSGYILLRDIEKSLSGVIMMGDAAQDFSLHCQEEAQTLSKWMCSKDMPETIQPSSCAVVSDLSDQMSVAMIKIIASSKAED